MSLKLFIGLALQVIAILLILFRVRRRRLAYTGILFVSMSVVYHGLSELFQIAFPGMNFYRTLVSQDKIDSWVLIFGLAILTFAVTYCYRLRPLSTSELETPPQLTLGLVNWLWGILSVVLLQLMVAGSFGRFDLGYWGSLVTDTLPALTVLVLAEFIYKMRGRYLLLALIFQIGLGVLSGSRMLTLISAVVLLSVLFRCGVPIRWRSLFLPGIIAVFLVVSISGMRSIVGRDAFSEQTNMQRIESLFAGTGAVMRDGFAPEILEDFVYRFDANAFNGLVTAGYEAGVKPAGWTPVLNNFFLAVPSFLNPTKLEGGLFKLSEESYLVDHFNMPFFYTSLLTGELTGATIDYTAGTWGILFGAFGTAGLLLIAVLMGWGFAAADSWIVRSRSLLAVLAGIWLTYATIMIEQGVAIYVLTGRAVLALFFVFMVLRQARALAAGSCRRAPTFCSLE